jgi:hypothetical protein
VHTPPDRGSLALSSQDDPVKQYREEEEEEEEEEIHDSGE